MHKYPLNEHGDVNLDKCSNQQKDEMINQLLNYVSDVVEEGERFQTICKSTIRDGRAILDDFNVPHYSWDQIGDPRSFWDKIRDYVLRK